MNYAVQVDSGAMIFIPSFIKIGSRVQKLLGRIPIQTHRQQGDLKSLTLFFQNKESRLKTRVGIVCMEAQMVFSCHFP
jgi:hypothetical protein